MLLVCTNYLQIGSIGGRVHERQAPLFPDGLVMDVLWLTGREAYMSTSRILVQLVVKSEMIGRHLFFLNRPKSEAKFLGRSPSASMIPIKRETTPHKASGKLFYFGIISITATRSSRSNLINA